jgi:hypothetical protein
MIGSDHCQIATPVAPEEPEPEPEVGYAAYTGGIVAVVLYEYEVSNFSPTYRLDVFIQLNLL